MADQLELMYRYEHWANGRALDSLRRASHRGKGVELFAHILAAQAVWLARLRGEAQEPAVWPGTSLEECGGERERLEAELNEYLGSAEFAENRPVSYRNTAGDEFENTPRDILTHVALHGQHHRGQIALELRRLGEEPAASDLIVYLRE